MTEVEIIAEHHGYFDIHRLMFVCRCGETWPALSDDYDREIKLHSAHVVSRLWDAGHTIVPSDGIVRTYQAASTHGRAYMMPKGFGCDREEAKRWFELHQSALAGLPGVDTVRLEYRDEFATGWLPLAAAASPTQGDHTL